MSHSELEKLYDSKTEGKAVFFSPHAGKSFYFEPALGWEFSYSDGNPDGTSVLYGTFYYNKCFFNQTPECPIAADFLVKLERVDHILYAHIKFYVPGSLGENDLLGEFLAKDLDNVVSAFEQRGERLTGKWNVVYSNSL